MGPAGTGGLQTGRWDEALASAAVDSPVEQLVDLDRYPLHGPDGQGFRDVVSSARSQLTGTGAVELPGFLVPAGIDAMVAEADVLAARGHHSEGVGTAYLEYPDFSLPDGHPRLTWGHYGSGPSPTT